MKKKKITLLPKDYIVLKGGLRIENVGDEVIGFEEFTYITMPMLKKIGYMGTSNTEMSEHDF